MPTDGPHDLRTPPTPVDLGPGARRRRYLVWSRGGRCHVYGRYRSAEGPIAVCGRAGGLLVGFPDVEGMPLCESCLRKLLNRAA